MKKLTLIITSLIAISVLVVSCGGDSDDGGDSTNGTTTTQTTTSRSTTTAQSTTTASTTTTAATTTEQGGNGGDATQLTIVAHNLEFDKDTLTAPASTEIEVVLDNQDLGVPHNISFYESDDAAEEIFKGELFPGVEERTFTFETPEAGTYFFRCDVHPDMSGTFIVE